MYQSISTETVEAAAQIQRLMLQIIKGQAGPIRFDGSSLPKDNPFIKLGKTFNELVATIEAREQDLQSLTISAGNLAEKTEAADKAKNLFLENMNYKIRSPLNDVIGMLHLLLNTSLTAEQKDFAQTSQQSADRLLVVINDLLDFTNIQTGRIALEPAEHDLRQGIHSIIDILKIKAAGKGLELSSVIDPEVPTRIRADASRIRQVLNKLIGNAIKFTVKGSILLRVSVKPQAPPDRTTLHFEVKDTGIGISPEDQKRLFRPFPQSHASHTRRRIGTGLGLAIAKSFTEAMRGEIGVTSDEDTGSTFWFTIQIPATAENSTAAKKPPAESTVPAAHILLAEDNAINKKVAILILKKNGFTVDAVDNGEDALAALRTTPYDLILMDCEMPVMNGYETAAKIRSNPSSVNSRKIPIIAMTANALQDERDKCLLAGMNDHIAKPINPKTLKAAIEMNLPKKSLQESINQPPQAEPAREASASVAPAIFSETKVFDRENLLDRLGGDEEILQEVILLFLADTPKLIDTIQAALRTGDAEALRRAAHTLKGSSGNVGALTLQEAATRIDYAGKNGDLETARSLIQLLPNELEKLQKTVDATSQTPI